MIGVAGKGACSRFVPVGSRRIPSSRRLPASLRLMEVVHFVERIGVRSQSRWDTACTRNRPAAASV